jgi:hypothetical protein
MTKKTLFVLSLSLAAIVAVAQNHILIELTGQGGKGVIAIPELRGTGEAQAVMGVFNQRFGPRSRQSGLFRMAPRTAYPLQAPQRPQDIRGGQAPAVPTAPVRRGAAPPPPAQPTGMYLSDWAGPPVSANYLAFGYTAAQNGRLVLMGYFYNVNQPDAANAQVFGKIYNAALNADGAKQAAREFAADILKQFGMESLAGSKVIFVSTRTGAKKFGRWTTTEPINGRLLSIGRSPLPRRCRLMEHVWHSLHMREASRLSRFSRWKRYGN